MSVADVRALPWWERELLLDGLVAEAEGRQAPQDGAPGNFQPTSLGQLGITPTQVT